MNRRSCSAWGRPRHAGCLWNVRNDPRSPCASITSSTTAGPAARIELVLEVGIAHEETESFHVGDAEFRPKASPLERLSVVVHLSRVAEAREDHLGAARPEQVQEATDVLGAADRHDRDALGAEVPATAPRERLERELVAHALDEDDRAREPVFTALHARHGTETAPSRLTHPRGPNPSCTRLTQQGR